MVKVLMLTFLLLTSFEAMADNQHFDIKGFHIGMTEHEVLARYSNLKKEKSTRNANTKYIAPACNNNLTEGQRLLADRVCKTELLLLSDVGEASFFFNSNVLVAVAISILHGKFETYATALKKKFGAPISDGAEVIWDYPKEEFTLLKRDDTLYLYYEASHDDSSHRQIENTNGNASEL